MIVGDSIATVPAAKTAANGTGNGLSSDFDTFLQLLTAQIRNQDPLNPADSTEFVAQLATFSNVEQAVQTNDLLKAMSTQLSEQNLGQMSSWVGMEARAAMPVNVDGSDKTLILGLPVIADKAELVVRNEAGAEVQRFTIDPDAPQMTWSGKDPLGNQLPNGIYDVYVEASSSGNVMSPIRPETYAEITEASLADGEVILQFPGGIALKSGSVQGVRQPQP